MRGLCDTDHPFIRSPRGLLIFTPVEEQGVGTVSTFFDYLIRRGLASVSDLPHAKRTLYKLSSGMYNEYIFFESHFSRKDIMSIYENVKIFVKHLFCNLSDSILLLFVIYLCLRLKNCKCSKLNIACVIFICK